MPVASRSRPVLADTGSIVVLPGSALAGGGLFLATRGGSLHHVCAGAGLAVTGFSSSGAAAHGAIRFLLPSG